MRTIAQKQEQEKRLPENFLGRYTILAKLGEGGVGKVYKAWDPKLRRDVAIKVLKNQTSLDENQTASFLQEARTMAALKHENIIQILDMGGEQKDIFLVMEYIQGKTLAEKIKYHYLPVPEAMQILSNVAHAIHYMHENKVIHRDLKPSNIMLDPNGKVKVMDLGIAKRVSQERETSSDALSSKNDFESDIHEHTQSNIIHGSIGYMAPEQYDGISDACSDVYSLGVILYEVLVGRRPFPGVTVENVLLSQLQDQVEPPSHYREDIPKKLETICLRAIRNERKERYPNAREFALDLQNYGASSKKKSMILGVAGAFCSLFSIVLFLLYMNLFSKPAPATPQVIEKPVVVMPEVSVSLEIKEITQALSDKELSAPQMQECESRLIRLKDKANSAELQSQILFLTAQILDKKQRYSEAYEMYEQTLQSLQNAEKNVAGQELWKISFRAALCAWEAKKMEAARKHFLALQKEPGLESLPQKNWIEIRKLGILLAWEEKDLAKVRREYKESYRIKMEKSFSQEEFQPIADILFTIAQDLVRRKQYQEGKVFFKDVQEYFKKSPPYWEWLYFSTVCDFYWMQQNQILAPKAMQKVKEQFSLICQRSSKFSSVAFFFYAYFQMKFGEDASYSLQQAAKNLVALQNHPECLGLLEDSKFRTMVGQNKDLSCVLRKKE